LFYLQVRRKVVDQLKGQKDEYDYEYPSQDLPNCCKRCAETVVVRDRFSNPTAVKHQRQRSDNQHSQRNRQQNC
jgi:hypothetical protein